MSVGKLLKLFLGHSVSGILVMYIYLSISMGLFQLSLECKNRYPIITTRNYKEKIMKFVSPFVENLVFFYNIFYNILKSTSDQITIISFTCYLLLMSIFITLVMLFIKSKERKIIIS